MPKTAQPWTDIEKVKVLIQLVESTKIEWKTFDFPEGRDKKAITNMIYREKLAMGMSSPSKVEKAGDTGSGDVKEEDEDDAKPAPKSTPKKRTPAKKKAASAEEDDPTTPTPKRKRASPKKKAAAPVKNEPKAKQAEEDAQVDEGDMNADGSPAKRVKAENDGPVGDDEITNDYEDSITA